jgi:hypothetical protein
VFFADRVIQVWDRDRPVIEDGARVDAVLPPVR